MKMKLAVFFLGVILTLGICTGMTASASAAEDSDILSPGLTVLASQSIMRCSTVLPASLPFTAEQFDESLGIRVSAVTIDSLPSAEKGTLVLGNVAVVPGQTVERSEISSLKFVPTQSTGEASFVFGSESTNSPYRVSCVIQLLEKENTAPTLSDISTAVCSVLTYNDIAIESKMQAYDADSTSLSFEITQYPENGVLKAKSNGSYCYYPYNDFVGSDAFSYRACDNCGNYSTEQTVTIQVKENKANINFDDLTEEQNLRCAVYMTENGIMSATLADGKRCFAPNDGVNRAEFITMAMKSCGYSVIGYKMTPYEDDSAIPTEYRGYVAAACELGFLSGEGEFGADRPITRTEAATILNAMNCLSQSVATTVYEDQSDLDNNALAALSSLHELAPLPGFSDTLLEPTATVTREQCSVILTCVMQMTQSR